MLCVLFYFHCLFYHLRMSGLRQPFECLADGPVLVNHLELYQLKTNVRAGKKQDFPQMVSLKLVGFFHYFLFFSFLLNFSICIGVWPISNVVIVSAGQQRDSAIHIHVPFLPHTPLPTRLAGRFLTTGKSKTVQYSIQSEPLK